MMNPGEYKLMSESFQDTAIDHMGQGNMKFKMKSAEWEQLNSKAKGTGSTELWLKIGLLYLNGVDLTNNKRKVTKTLLHREIGLNHLLHCAKHGNAVAQLCVGFNALNNKQEQEALKAWQAAANTLNSAKNNLAVLYARGRDTKQDLKKALELFTEVAKSAPNSVANQNLIVLYAMHHESLAKVATEKALEEFEKKIAHDNNVAPKVSALASFNLGYRSLNLNQKKAFDEKEQKEVANRKQQLASHGIRKDQIYQEMRSALRYINKSKDPASIKRLQKMLELYDTESERYLQLSHALLPMPTEKLQKISNLYKGIGDEQNRIFWEIEYQISLANTNPNKEIAAKLYLDILKNHGKLFWQNFEKSESFNKESLDIQGQEWYNSLKKIGWRELFVMRIHRPCRILPRIIDDAIHNLSYELMCLMERCDLLTAETRCKRLELIKAAATAGDCEAAYFLNQEELKAQELVAISTPSTLTFQAPTATSSSSSSSSSSNSCYNSAPIVFAATDLKISNEAALQAWLDWNSRVRNERNTKKPGSMRDYEYTFPDENQLKIIMDLLFRTNVVNNSKKNIDLTNLKICLGNGEKERLDKLLMINKPLLKHK